MSWYEPQVFRRTAMVQGNVVRYDACSDNRDAYDPDVFEYIGPGTIHEIDGVRKSSDKTMHFWGRR